MLTRIRKLATLVIVFVLLTIQAQSDSPPITKQADTDAVRIVTNDNVIHKPEITEERTSATVSQEAVVHWQVLASGGGKSLIGGFSLGSTLGQSAAGNVHIGDYSLNSGYWQTFVTPGCCIGTRGNANADIEEDVNIADIVYLIDYLFGEPLGPEPACRAEGNANADIEDAINIADITFLIDYLFGIPLGPSPPPCQ